MSDHIDGSKRAFPVADPICEVFNGLSAREYAAIKLRVPDSGTEWLDAMIRKSLRDDFAAKAVQGMLSDSEGINEDTGVKFSLPDDADMVAFCCYAMADGMLKARDDA